MDALRAKLASLAPEQSLAAEGAMRAQYRNTVEVPPEAPVPDDSDEGEEELDLTPWEALHG